MVEAVARRRLNKAEAAIEQETEEIGKQRAFIQKLRDSGHGTERAERSLKMIEHSLAAMKHHREILLEHLGLYEAGESGSHRGVYSGPPVKGHDPNKGNG